MSFVVYIAAAIKERDARGRRLVVCSGHAEEREIQTGVAPAAIRAPRVRDARQGEAGEPLRFSSKILPPYLRKTRSVEELLPWLYLQGVSTNGFEDALQSIFGANAPGLSSRTIVRLREVWEEGYASWTRRPLGAKRYVYIWIDGVHVNVRLPGERSCILVVIGATSEGEKELLAVHDGEVLSDPKGNLYRNPHAIAMEKAEVEYRRLLLEFGLTPTALVYLRNNVAAQRLAVAWPLVEDRARAENPLLRDWARLADVPLHQAESLAPVLRSHGICRDDGSLDPLAEQCIGAQVQATIPRAKR